jgi:hypothetical protein
MSLKFDQSSLNAGIAALAAQVVRAGDEALEDWLDARVVDAQKRVPVETGTLHDAIYREGHEIIGDTEYAIYVHEDLEAQHPEGEAKFLERPMLEKADELPAGLAVKISGGAA